MDIEFNGKTVLVTGGAGGIGKAVSLLFAKAGANVMVNYIPTKSDIQGLKRISREIEQFRGNFYSFEGDITSQKSTKELCDKTYKRFGSLDILINCAGYIKPEGINNIQFESWEKCINVNLTGAFYVSYYASKYMRKTKKGKIIFMGSAGSITGGGGSAAYSASKAGINGLVRAFSKELAPEGITVNAILPAYIETNMLKNRHPDLSERNKIIDRIPVGRFGNPEDVAFVAMFLASNYADYITGQNIIVDGGSVFK
jgi:3-oxoacyl-[acyl-carrier protein] reductase